MRPRWDLPLQATGMVVELENGTTVQIRPVRAGDRETLLTAFERLSPDSRYLRFFNRRPSQPESLISALTDVEHEQHLAWAVFDPSEPSEVGDGSGLAIGAARLIVDQDDPTNADTALAIVDDYQGRGIGRFLIELLVGTAAQYGIARLRFEVLDENEGMRALLEKVGATPNEIPEEPAATDFHLLVPPIEDQEFAAGALYVLLRDAAAGGADAEDD